jgi:glucoamylase
MSDRSANYRWIDGQGEAFGAPGVEPRWSSSAKDLVGTAYSASSRVWYTVSHGILNEIYYPTIDRPQTRDMEFLLTDGESFFHEEKRDLDRKFEYIDPDALAVRLTHSDPDGRYTLTKEIISDPHHSVVLMRVRLSGEEQTLARLKVYALLAPHLEVGGAGNSGGMLDVAGKRVLLAWKNSTSLAMTADCGFTRSSCGYVGASDGWQDLMDNFRMDWEFGTALDGNIALTGEIDVSVRREFVVAISLGQGHHAALTTALEALNVPFDQNLKRFIEQWHRVLLPGLRPAATDGGRLLQISHKMILAHEDKEYAGAFIASASIPWGQFKGDDDLAGYHRVWTRDMVQSASALLACGIVDTPRRALVYLACTQKPDGSFAQNFWIDGTPYWRAIQLDEVAFPVILAWRLWKHEGLNKFDIFPFVERAAGFLVRRSPVTEQERWEEVAGYSPSTLAVVISGLICAAEIARDCGAAEVAGFLEEHADWIQAHLEDWTVTNDGVLMPGVKRHYMRIRPVESGEPYTQEGAGEETIVLNNQPPGARFEYEAREVIDAGFLELVRYGVRPADDPLIVDSLRVVDHVLKVETPRGPCWRRYNHDGYGQRADGGPYMGSGQGRAWPLLTGERGHYELAAGRDVKPFISAIEHFSSIGGMLPEQVWDEADRPECAMFLGAPIGAAMPLVWAHAEYLKLLRSAADGAVFDRIEAVENRYARGRRESAVEIFSLARQIKRMAAGKKLRVLALEDFRLVWSADGWETVSSTQSSNLGFIGHFADIATMPEQPGRISFTFEWLTPGRWEGKNFDVELGGPQKNG